LGIHDHESHLNCFEYWGETKRVQSRHEQIDFFDEITKGPLLASKARGVDDAIVTVLRQLRDGRLDFVQIYEFLITSCSGLGGLDEDMSCWIGTVAN
jgi:hypothetical protein